MENLEQNKVFRAEKSTKNRDDFKVLMVGLMVGIALLLILPLAGRVYDTNFATRPFVAATVEVVQTLDYDRPMVLYDADATRFVDAVWVAVIRDEFGIRLESRRGKGSYTPTEDNPYLWSWKGFFDAEDGVPPPDVPNEPFMVCVRYIAVTIDTGVPDDSPEFCSAVFHPGLPPQPIVEDVE